MHRETETWTSNQVSGWVGFKRIRWRNGPVEKYLRINYEYNLTSIYLFSSNVTLSPETNQFEWLTATHWRTYGKNRKLNRTRLQWNTGDLYSPRLATPGQQKRALIDYSKRTLNNTRSFFLNDSKKGGGKLAVANFFSTDILRNKPFGMHVKHILLIYHWRGKQVKLLVAEAISETLKMSKIAI